MIIAHRGIWPTIHETGFVAPSADIIGDVEVGEHSSVWFQCVLRGDLERIRIGARTNVQDHTVIHTTRRQSHVEIGDDVTIGHRATLHGCRIGNRVLIGMGAIILDNAEIGDDCIVAAGALITKNTKVPNGSLVLGSPAKVVRSLSEKELAFLPESAANYVGDAHHYGHLGGPVKHGASNRDLETLYEDEFEL